MKKDKIELIIAVFRAEFAESQLLIGEGFTVIEAIVRAIELNLSDDLLNFAIDEYGPDDFEGLREWYLNREIYISNPFIQP